MSTNLVAFAGRYLNSTPHRHLSACVTVSLDGPIRYRTGDGKDWRETLGLAARENAALEIHTGEARVVNLQLDPERQECQAVRSLPFADSDVFELEEARFSPLIEKLRALVERPNPEGQPMRDCIVEALSSGPLTPRVFDARVARVLKILKQSFPEAPTCAELSSAVSLSEGRLIHLFAEQVGVPLRRYILFQRVRHMLFCWAVGLNLTDAAHESGFADSAHLARVFREMFGFAPSKILRSERVQVRLEAPRATPETPFTSEDLAQLSRFREYIIKAQGQEAGSTATSSPAKRPVDP